MSAPTPRIGFVAEPARAAAVLEPLRRRLLHELQKSPRSAAALAQELGEPRQRLNYHLRELEKAGFVEVLEERRKGNCIERVLRPTARYFVIDPAAAELGPDPAALADRFSASYLLALAGRAVREVASGAEGARAQGKRLATAALETEVRLATPGDFRAFVEELAAAVAAVVEKRHDAATPGGRTFRVLLASHQRPAKDRGGDRR